MPDKKRILILGGGFAGLSAAQTLKRADADVTLIDRRNFHLFQPLLYQVATGSLSPGQIAAPLRSVLRRQQNTEIFLGEAGDIDPVGKKLFLRDGGVFPYDYLIVGTGSKTSYYGNEEWREDAPSLKTVEEATAIRHKLLFAFEKAERSATEEEARAWLTFVIVGAGATGLELAGAIAEIAKQTLRLDFRRIRPEEASIILLEGGPRVLAGYPEDLSAKAEKLVTRLGVEVRKDTFVTGIDEHGLDFKQGERTGRLEAKTILWTGGVDTTSFGRKLAERTSSDTEKSGKIKVLPDLTVAGFPDIFVAGDLAYVVTKQGRQVPGVAQPAIQEGHYAAKVILARLKGEPAPPPFHYFDKGDMAVIGRAAAVANVFGIHISGLLAWLTWLFIHLMYIVQFQSRVMVFIQWGFEYFTFSRGARIITGPISDEEQPQPEPQPATAKSASQRTS
jgi:NADH:ubiquinone reductase (H+-translocating)